jgi:hypothetical protein
MVLERGTDPKRSRRTYACEYELQSCRGKSVGVTRRPRELISHPKPLPSRFATLFRGCACGGASLAPTCRLRAAACPSMAISWRSGRPSYTAAPSSWHERRMACGRPCCRAQLKPCCCAAASAACSCGVSTRTRARNAARQCSISRALLARTCRRGRRRELPGEVPSWWRLELGVIVDKSALSGPNREPRSRNVKLIGWCQSVRESG